jgi:hypothetical protein
MAATPYLVQLPDPDTAPARQLQDGDDTYVVVANSSADALAFVQNYGNKTLFDDVTPVVQAAASLMTNWSLRVRIYSATTASPPTQLTNDFTVQTVGVAARAVLATGVLTSSADYANNDTVTIGSQVYTFKTTLTGAAYEVLRGVSESNTISNLVAAINGGAGAGTAYGTGTVASIYVTAVAGSHTVTVTALDTYTAAQADAIATTNVSGGSTASWGHTTLTGAVDTTDLPSSLAGLMVAALVDVGLHAAFNNSTQVLTIASIADNIGDHKLLVEFIPPPEETPYKASSVGVTVQNGVAVPGFLLSQVDGGVAGAVLTATIVTDAYVIPNMIVKAKAQQS